MTSFGKKTVRNLICALYASPILFCSVYAMADEAPAGGVIAAPAVDAPAAEPAEPTSPHSLTFNLGLYSNYMFRGVALSDGPALQGGADYAHSSGFYAGTWFSNIDKNFTGHGDGFSGGNKIEIDIYGGYAHTFENGFGINLMGNYYWYPDREKSATYLETGVSDGRRQDSFEASIGLSYEFLTYTYYNVLTNYYGAAASGTNNGKKNTKNADYHELKMTHKLPGDLSIMAKVGYQNTKNLTGDQGDYAIGISRDFSLPTASGKPIEGFNAGAVFTNTFAVQDEAYYETSDGRDTNDATITFYVKRTW
jgi:uncharacterized protein (TIGR02001 family)